MSSPRIKTPRTCKLLIIGAHGLVGSSAFAHAAKIASNLPKRSATFYAATDVIAIDQFSQGHEQGSSHGESRITRLAIGEGNEYVPLAKKSHQLWQAIEDELDCPGALLNLPKGGGLIVGPNSAGSQASYHGAPRFVQQSIDTANGYKIPYKSLNNADLRQNYPQFNFSADDIGYFEPTMGYINPDKCVAANLAIARKYHGELRENEKAEHFKQLEGGKIKVTTSKNGQEYEYITDKLIIAAGPWLNNLVKAEELKVYRECVYWFKIAEEAREQYSKENFPTFIWSFDNKRMVYGFPIIDENEGFIKMGSEDYSTVTTPETVDRVVSQDEITAIYEKVIKPNFNGITSECVKSQVCLYTVAPEWKFVIDYLHQFGDRVIVASPCSGHGAKHAAAVGFSLAQECLLGKSDIPVMELFSGMFSRVEPEQQLTILKMQ